MNLSPKEAKTSLVTYRIGELGSVLHSRIFLVRELKVENPEAFTETWDELGARNHEQSKPQSQSANRNTEHGRQKMERLCKNKIST
jgi:hypothetical protein